MWKRNTNKKKTEWKKIEQFIKDNGIINSFTVTSPNNGYHSNFRLNSNNQDIKYIIDNVFCTRTYLGGYSIDIRSNNGYTVAPPSSMN